MLTATQIRCINKNRFLRKENIRMTQTIKRLLLPAIIALGLLAPVALTTTVTSAQGIAGGLQQGAESVDEEGASVDAEDTVNNIITTVINIFSLVVGVISVIMIIIGGLKYITSGGDSGNVTGAKNTILYAIIGLVVVALAQIIVLFVLSRIAPQ